MIKKEAEGGGRKKIEVRCKEKEGLAVEVGENAKLVRCMACRCWVLMLFDAQDDRGKIGLSGNFLASDGDRYQLLVCGQCLEELRNASRKLLGDWERKRIRSRCIYHEIMEGLKEAEA
jgi:hypothetical protein